MAIGWTGKRSRGGRAKGRSGTIASGVWIGATGARIRGSEVRVGGTEVGARSADPAGAGGRARAGSLLNGTGIGAATGLATGTAGLATGSGASVAVSDRQADRASRAGRRSVVRVRIRARDVRGVHSV